MSQTSGNELVCEISRMLFSTYKSTFDELFSPSCPKNDIRWISRLRFCMKCRDVIPGIDDARSENLGVGRRVVIGGQNLPYCGLNSANVFCTKKEAKKNLY